MVTALIAGHDDAEIDALCAAAARLLGEDVRCSTTEVDRSSADPDVAWGTEQPEIDDSEPVPLPAGGAVVDVIHAAAKECDADVIVVATDHRGWFSRLFRGSAVTDLVEEPGPPVLVVTLPGDAASPPS